jgi:hypothetical protein
LDGDPLTIHGGAFIPFRGGDFQIGKTIYKGKLTMPVGRSAFADNDFCNSTIVFGRLIFFRGQDHISVHSIEPDWQIRELGRWSPVSVQGRDQLGERDHGNIQLFANPFSPGNGGNFCCLFSYRSLPGHHRM